MHCRQRPVTNAFRYPVYYLLFDVDELPRLDRELVGFGYNRWRPVALHDADYGRPPVLPLRESIEQFLASHGVAMRPTRIELLTHARTFGYVFNPVSYFYCLDADDRLQCIVAEVNNTFGDRIRYLLTDTTSIPWPGGRGYLQSKEMHVSPFMPMHLEYKWYFSRHGARLTVRMDESERGERFFRAQLTGRLEPLTGRSLLSVALRFPLMPVQVVALIHWQALKLYLKGAPHFSRPAFEETWTSVTNETGQRGRESLLEVGGSAT